MDFILFYTIIYLLLCFFTIYLFLYKVKEIYGNIKDFALNNLVPKVILIVPILILFLFFYYFNISFIWSYIIFLFVHFFITIPVLYYLNKIQKWVILNEVNDDEYSNKVIVDWRSPYLIYDLSLGLNYVYFYGLILLILRVLMLGQVRDFGFLFQQEFIPFIVLFFCYLPAIIYYGIRFLVYFNNIRIALWTRIANIVYYIHLGFLQNNTYFKVMEKLYKTGYF